MSYLHCLRSECILHLREVSIFSRVVKLSEERRNCSHLDQLSDISDNKISWLPLQSIPELKFLSDYCNSARIRIWKWHTLILTYLCSQYIILTIDDSFLRVCSPKSSHNILHIAVQFIGSITGWEQSRKECRMKRQQLYGTWSFERKQNSTYTLINVENLVTCIQFIITSLVRIREIGEVYISRNFRWAMKIKWNKLVADTRNKNISGHFATNKEILAPIQKDATTIWSRSDRALNYNK